MLQKGTGNTGKNKRGIGDGKNLGSSLLLLETELTSTLCIHTRDLLSMPKS